MCPLERGFVSIQSVHYWIVLVYALHAVWDTNIIPLTSTIAKVEVQITCFLGPVFQHPVLLISNQNNIAAVDSGEPGLEYEGQSLAVQRASSPHSEQNVVPTLLIISWSLVQRSFHVALGWFLPQHCAVDFTFIAGSGGLR